MTVENMKTGFVERIGGTIFVVNAMPAENAKHTQEELVKALIAREAMALQEAEVTQQGKPSKLDTRMKFLQENNPLGANHPAVKQYNKCMRGAGDTVSSIIISANSRLAFLENKQVLRLLSKDDLNLPEIGIGVNGDGETKTALFCVIPDSDKSYNFIIGMLYTQIFQELYYQADFNCGGRLPIHVTFMLDEFANVALPDDYILDEIAKFVAVPHNSCRSFSGTAAVRPSLNICRRADDICFRIFRKVNNYANRSNIRAMFKKIHHKSLFLTI